MNAQISDTFFLSKSVGTTLASEKNLFHIKIETNIMQKIYFVLFKLPQLSQSHLVSDQIIAFKIDQQIQWLK